MSFRRKDLKKICEEIYSRLNQFQEQLSKVESCISGEARHEEIDQLAKQVENLEKRILSKWEVALTVGTIIAGIAFVVVATYAVMKFIGT